MKAQAVLGAAEEPQAVIIFEGQTMRAWTSLLASKLFLLLAPLANADEFKLGENQKISCTRGHRPGKLSTAVCKSYTYLLNVTTADYFRCSIALALTRDKKEVINVHSDGECVRKPRIFDNNSTYSFEAAETAPPNTNSFFGAGGYAVWASDNTTQSVRGCIIVTSGLGSDVSECVNMTFR
jgi:hypothetical protein